MRSPTLARLRATFPDCDARLIKRLCAAADDRDALRAIIEAQCPETDRYARSCYNDPYHGGMWRRTLILHAIDRILGTCGVEPLGAVDMRQGPPYEYCNAGDPYVATLIYKRETDTVRIGSWGDIVEREGIE